jgi:hypothetical protein
MKLTQHLLKSLLLECLEQPFELRLPTASCVEEREALFVHRFQLIDNKFRPKISFIQPRVDG